MTASDGWQERLVASLDPPPGTRGTKPSGRTPLRGQYRTSLNLTDTMGALLRQVCIRRGINRTGYVRRVLAVHIAAELDMDVADVLRDTPLPVGYGERRFWHREKREDLAGIQTYCPHPGCDGTHIRR